MCKKGQEWTENEIEYLKNNYKLPYKELMKVLDRTRGAIQVKIKRLGLKKINYELTNRIFDKDFFEKIDNEEKAYWLGFICADGCIHYNKDGYGTLKITLQKSDDNFLRKFIKSIHGNFDVKYCTNFSYGKMREYCEVSFKCKKMVDDLNKYITPNKTNTLTMPEIPIELERHFLRGFSDGDGSFYCGDKTNRKSFEIVSNSPNMINSIKNIFDKNNICGNIYHKKNGNLKYGIYNFESLKLLHDYFYKDMTICMERKYLKSQKIMELAS